MDPQVINSVQASSLPADVGAWLWKKNHVDGVSIRALVIQGLRLAMESPHGQDPRYKDMANMLRTQLVTLAMRRRMSELELRDFMDAEFADKVRAELDQLMAAVTRDLELDYGVEDF